MANEKLQTIPPMQSTPTIRAENIKLETASGSTPATKIFAVSATGNLFVASTLNGGEGANASLTQAAQQAFEQVSIFFAAMTKAIAETPDPNSTATPKESYSIYNYDALGSIIKKSGLFIQVTENDIEFESSSWGAEFSSDLVQAILGGFSGDLASISQSLVSLISSAGKEGFKLSHSNTQQKSKVGSIIFICEYLLGAVSITPIVVYIEVGTHKDQLQVGACFKSYSESMSWKIHKDVYLFVPPSFMQEAGNMNTAMSNPQFLKLVEQMKADLKAGNSPDTSTNAATTKPSAGSSTGTAGTDPKKP